MMIIEERGDIVEQQRGGVEFLERDIYRTVFKGFFKNEMGRKVWIYEKESLGGVYYVGHIIIPRGRVGHNRWKVEFSQREI